MNLNKVWVQPLKSTMICNHCKSDSKQITSKMLNRSIIFSFGNFFAHQSLLTKNKLFIVNIDLLK